MITNLKIKEIRQDFNVADVTEPINKRLIEYVKKTPINKVEKVPIKLSPSYRKKMDIKCHIPLYFRPINDKEYIDFGILYTNTRNEKFKEFLKNWLKEKGFYGGLIYDGYGNHVTEIGFSQFIRRWLGNPEEQLAEDINKYIEENYELKTGNESPTT